MSEKPEAYTVTMKAHGSHDATWVVIKAESQTDLVDKLDGFTKSGISALIGEAVTALRAEETLGAILGARPVDHPGQYDPGSQNGSQAPQGGYQAPPQGGYQAPPQGGYQAPQSAPPAATPYGNPPTCPHGVKRFIEKPYKNKPGTWRAWSCPAPQGTPDQCSLEFIK